MLITLRQGGSAQLTLNGRPYILNPTAEVPDEAGAALLRDEDMGRHFMEAGAKAPAPVEASVSNLVCDVCGKPMRSLAGLGSHKRIHKERT